MATPHLYDVTEDQDNLRDPVLESKDSIMAYVLGLTKEWEDFRETNFHKQWDEYNRLWRGQWAAEDKTRSSERSRIITPALQQAVESSVAEIEEATFGHGKLFDIRDDSVDKDDQDIAFLRNKLDEDFRKQKIRKAAGEVLINAAVYGTGIAEVVLGEIKEMAPAKEPIMDGQMAAVGVNVTTRTVVTMRPIQPKNFLIDPVATSVEDAHGCATDEFVPAHFVTKLQQEGVYRKGFLGSAAPDIDIEPDSELDVPAHQDGKVRLLKYFGLVPKKLLDLINGETDTEADSDEPYVDDLLIKDTPTDTSEGEELVEAIIIIGNGGVLLKAEASPFMMQDRPIVAFQWDNVPGLFWGRGVCEKGYNSQKALDAEIRARIDALALTIHPMMAMDATRIPRGHKPIISPGKFILTTGKPSEVLQPFNFGNVSQITFAQAGELQKMVQQSTGAVDASGLPGTVNGEATAAGISMSLGAIIKRQKRTLLNYQDGFWLPFVEKAAWRYMQFDPEHYPVKDFHFIASSTLGIMAREYEVTQLVQLLQTMSPESPLYPALIEAIVDNMNITNREELVATLKEAGKPNPEKEAQAKEAHETAMGLQKAQVEAVGAQANESNSRAQKYAEETRLLPKELEVRKIDAITKNLQPGAAEDQEFTRRLKIAETRLKEKDLNIRQEDLQLRRAASSSRPTPATGE